MSIFDFLKPKKNTAQTAKNRLQIIAAQERSSAGAPDYLPLMRRGILEVIRKYVNVDTDAVKVDVVKGNEARRAGYFGIAARTRGHAGLTPTCHAIPGASGIGYRSQHARTTGYAGTKYAIDAACTGMTSTVY